MTTERLTLQPFTPPASAASHWRLTARADRQDGLLHLHYRLEDPEGAQDGPRGLVLEGRAAQRQDNLWQHTCFEAFIAIPGQEAYWELNLAPGGGWNLYRLSSYRSPLEPEQALQQLPLASRQGHGWLTLETAVPLPAPPAAAAELQLNLCAVLEAEGGELSYWALHHPGPEADFHRRDGFRLLLG